MLAVIVASVLSLVSPLVGLTFEEGVGGEPKPTSTPTVLDPRTLRPVEGAPRLPGVRQFEMSPAGDRIVSPRRDQLVFTSLRTGRELGRMRLARARSATLSWIARDRLLVIECRPTAGPSNSPFCDETNVRLVDPVDREVVGETLTFPAASETARVGSRQILLLKPRDPWCCSGRPSPSTPRPDDDNRYPTVLVLDSRGRPEHVVELPEIRAPGGFGVSEPGMLDGSLVTGEGRNPGQRRVLRIDAARGRIAARHIVEHSAERGWLLPGASAAAVLDSACECRYDSFDRRTLEPLATFEWEKRAEPPMPAGSGYIARKWLSTERQTLHRYDIRGREVWSRDIPPHAYVRPIGPYVYVQWDESSETDPRRFYIDVYRLRDGSRLTRRRRGRFDLRPPSAGRSYPQVPGLFSSQRFRIDEN